MGKQLINLIGSSFGRLTVLERGPNKGRRACWVCRCSCGEVTLVTSEHLRNGKTRSCGCLRRENSKQLTDVNPPVSFRYSDPEIPAYNHVLCTYIHNAKARGRDWNLSKGEAIALLSSTRGSFSIHWSGSEIHLHSHESRLRTCQTCG